MKFSSSRRHVLRLIWRNCRPSVRPRRIKGLTYSLTYSETFYLIYNRIAYTYILIILYIDIILRADEPEPSGIHLPVSIFVSMFPHEI